MAKVVKIYEKSIRQKKGNVQHQTLKVTVPSYEFDDYEDCDINLYIDGVFIAEIGSLLGKAGVFTDLVDHIDWKKEAADV